MRGIIRANVNLPGFRRGEEREVEITDEVTRRAAKGIVSVVWTEGGQEGGDPDKEPDDVGAGEGDDEG